ncbi:DUF1294 domain-containing protein [Clostridium massiliamazoniense]|uniref:DUF1294 domain-containing protein n=1 Tax=Clostridium massiliamazoniense TaxID=1347366 RepID=UPI000B2B8EDE|nr:DUF1294 domain-containing protein [Clostridium massiliamazoniense]
MVLIGTYLILINLIGFFIMYYDKKKAIKGQWRISEATLITIAIIGGSIGVYLGMQNFRHKTKHLKFKVGIPIIIIFQIIFLGTLFK